MAISPLAGKPAPADILIDVGKLQNAYYQLHPDSFDPTQQVQFGTSGHRGSPLNSAFNEDHILAITQAIVEYRQKENIDGPLYIGMDTHAVSGPAQQSALEVLAAHGVQVFMAQNNAYTPTPVISHAILTYNRGRTDHLADGIVVTPSHNPPADGGFKYNPPSGGPAAEDITNWMQNRANELLAQKLNGVKRISYEAALKADSTHQYDFVMPYIRDLANVVNLEAVQQSGIHIGVDPLGGASVGYWEPIAEMYKLNLEVVNGKVDPTFSFMTVDHDGKIRMDCSSPYAMASLIQLQDRFDIAFGNDTDADRHGIVAPGTGLLNPNHYLSVAIWYLFQNRQQWPQNAAIGKTLVSSALIDRVGQEIGRQVSEVPVGFKWFVDGLLNGSYGFGGEESAGASFLRRDGSVWTTDKDGLIMNLLAAEITAVTGKNPGQHYKDLTARLGEPFYNRVDAPATPAQKARLKKLSPQDVSATSLAGEEITAKLTTAPGNGAAIGGLKVTTKDGWFAARPSGTENIYKIYAESFKSQEHLGEIITEAQKLVDSVLG